jgi:glycerate 2-kinase
MIKAVRNFDQLASSEGRRDALDIVEAAFASLDTKRILQKSITVTDGVMTVMGEQFDLYSFNRIYIVGFGKVSCKAARVLEEILEGKVNEGAVVGIKEVVCNTIDTYAGTHPLPSRLNLTATQHIEEIAHKAKKDDLVLVIVSGGGSALLCSSLEECDQGQKLYNAFLHSGGTIDELNTVRRHISRLKGGGLAKVLYPATVVGLVFSDVPGGNMESIASGPTVRSSTKISDAKEIIERYGLGEFNLIEKEIDEKYFDRVQNILVASNLTALKAMEEAAHEKGYRASIVSANVYATPEETRQMLLTEALNQPAVCMGGETKMIVSPHATGKGGRNTHLGICMVDVLKEDQVFVSFASDGKDNTDAAGAIVDKTTLEKARTCGLDIATYRDNFDSYTFLKETGDLVFTSPLESNVADLSLLLSPENKNSTII